MAATSVTGMNQPPSPALEGRFLTHLPGFFREGLFAEDGGHPEFLAAFLLAFEKVLLGVDDGLLSRPGSSEKETGYSAYDSLEEKIEHLALLFDPWQAPDEFLPWLSQWAALTLRADMPAARQRRIISEILPLYAIRGTARYMRGMLRLLVSAHASVTEGEMPRLEIGRHSTVGFDTYLNGGPPFFFKVSLIVREPDSAESQRQIWLAREVIERAKPAHTYFELNVTSPRMQIGEHSTLGVDTVLST